MTNQTSSQKTTNSINVARMYYYQNMTTDAIAKEMKVSRSTISRMLTYAREEGLVNIQIVDPRDIPSQLEAAILDVFELKGVHVVPVPEVVGEAEWLERVAQYTANYLNTIFESNMVLGIAWGTTMTAVSRHLLRKTTHNSQVVQLNGAGNTQSMGIDYASQIIMRFSENYRARAHLFPVPTFFDFPETKSALWREASIQRILDLQSRTDLLLYSIGAVNAGIPSHVYSGGYLAETNYKELEKYKIAGDIATVFFKEDGSFDNIPLNRRASGPSLQLFREKYGVCVVSGLAKVRGLNAALRGKLMSELIIDEPTARALVENYL
ncbi:MAG: sugar-binding transcriptional regulator [Chloroflexi bacterium]|jgi:deoxyribonucleoside regulator|nr:sugar-binding transcriptional regulator [Chloroflexota bacterium]MBT3669001.1 sugar-binding transcriptional regulator [Chloroflexota bacterium]MBT4003602.1 sugar-binding transcriptional regulator [Chloroflexota bacterium]MBT4304972.1 sugar-binding transcriptional regulator [Chloroflexota bacterium]MBT4533265.1 sugar-binding transcriptional regulator [Chloroflexota bacterium]